MRRSIASVVAEQGAMAVSTGLILAVNPSRGVPCLITCTCCLTTDVSRTYTGPGMIQGYRDRRTEAFAAGEFVPAFQSFEQQAARRLSILNAARSLETLRALRGNRLEALRGDRAGQYSIRINRQWRICFSWLEGQAGPSGVEIVDYH